MSEQTGEEIGELEILPPEPWGRRMRRARESRKMTLDDAVEAVGAYMLTSTASISRMEDAVDEPKDSRRRALAYLAARCYRFDPAQFGMSLEDLPKALAESIRASGPGGPGRPMAFLPEGVDPDELERGVKATRSTIHFRRNPGEGHRPAATAA